MAKDSSNQFRAHNNLADGTKIMGTVTAECDMRIDGQIEGDLICKGKVVLGESGKIEGKLHCSNAEILGWIKGSIEVSESLALKATAKVIGDIKTRILSIEPKAQFNGTCEMLKETSAKK